MATSACSPCSLLLLLAVAATAAAAICALSSLPCAAAAANAVAAGSSSSSSHHHHHLNLTAGFRRVRLSESEFVVQRPYDVPLHDRYEQSASGVRRMWVFATDKPISDTHPGAARTEIKVNKTYSSGVWQFEGDMYVPSGTSGASVMQIFGAAPPHASTLMLHVYGGRLTYYHDLARVLEDRVYDRWLRLSVIHDVAAGSVTVFVDGERRLAVPGRGGDTHYFKFGVYKQSHHHPSHRMESHWDNVAVYTKP